jgi:hypothetical protein
MANTPITELDFFAIKEQLKDYLKTQTRFKDYDYEGSNMSVLLDVLAYNTFQNNFYTNMAINEMFLDSAQLKSSVVSHAKELNYTPRSNVSPKATVRITIRDITETALTILIPQFSRFSSVYQGQTFNFITDKSYVAYRQSPGVFVADNVEIFEGEILDGFEKDGFIFSEDDDAESFKCILENENVDITTIKVFSDDDTKEYVFRKDIYGVEKDDFVFYVEPYFDEKYAVTFGGNVYGKQPTADTDVKISYRITLGPTANGANRFSANFRNGITVETISPASGGALRETLDSIKFFAPKSIQIQERAVTSRDYEILLKQRFPEIQAVSVFGGDELEPPQYGRVAVSINKQSNQQISTSFQNEVVRYLSDKTPLTIQPVFVNPEYLYAKIEVDVNYTLKTTSKSQGQLEQNVRNTIKNFTNANLNNFASILRHSKLSTAIDNTDISILSNALVIKPYIEYSPPFRIRQNPKFNFNAELKRPYNRKEGVCPIDYDPAIRSTVFEYQGICVYFRDDGTGNIQIVSEDITNFAVINPNIGTVDYKTGEVRLTNFIVDAYDGSGIKVVANVKNLDVTAPKNRVFLLKDTDVAIRLIEIK